MQALPKSLPLVCANVIPTLVEVSSQIVATSPIQTHSTSPIQSLSTISSDFTRFPNVNASHNMIIDTSIIEPPRPRLMTEDLGKTVEYSLCMLLNTPYHGKFQYSMEEANRIRDRLEPLKTTFDGYVHTGAKCPFTGQKNPPYDFRHSTIATNELSVKTIKTGSSWKICPQIIGQPTRKRFCQHFELPINSDPEQIKGFILSNVPKLMREYFHHTFHCPVLFYHQKSDIVKYIQRNIDVQPIAWNDLEYEFSYTRSANQTWNESTQLAIKHNSEFVTIGEFQVHNHRSGIKFRFVLNKLLKIFGDQFNVQTV